MQIGVQDKVIIITGAASGIGAAIARLAAQSGVTTLVLTDRDRLGLAAVADGLGHPATVVADLTNLHAPTLIAQAALDRFGRIDGLVNAAALTTRAAFLDGTPAIWDQLFAINTRAPFFLMQAVIADLRARQASGAIVNILSVNAACGLPELAIYAATKGALATLTRNAANAHMADRIRANGINLGWVATESEHHMQANVLGKGPNWQDRIAATLPLGRLVTADEAARLAVYLLSDASIPMSGAIIDLEQKVSGAP